MVPTATPVAKARIIQRRCFDHLAAADCADGE
jgi:hypothetical protein